MQEQRSWEDGLRTVYVSVLGQIGVTTKHLIEHPPEGYRMIHRRKSTNTLAETVQMGKPRVRALKRALQRFVPLNLAFNCSLDRFHRIPQGVDLTYSESSAIFRNEPWIIWLEVATQMAGYDQHQLQRWRRVLEHALASRNCRGVICHTEACKRSLLSSLNCELFLNKVHVIPSGWPLVPDVAPRSAKSGPVRILFVGASRNSFQFRIKGGWEALEAFAFLRQRYPNLEFIVRSDVEAGIRKRYEGLPGVQIMSDLVSSAELDRLYRSADIFWFPAHTLLSVSVLEAMAYGLPVITTDYYDNPEFVQDGKTGIVIQRHRHIPPWDTSEQEVRRALNKKDPEFVQKLVEATACLIENPGLRHRLGAAGREAIVAKFSLDGKNRKTKRAFDLATAARPAVRRSEMQHTKIAKQTESSWASDWPLC